jgi:hypothetical protein
MMKLWWPKDFATGLFIHICVRTVMIEFPKKLRKELIQEISGSTAQNQKKTNGRKAQNNVMRLTT